MSSNVNIGGILAGAQGQAAMAASLRVVIASDQTAIPATQSGTWTVQQGTTGAGAAAPWSARLSDGAAFYQAALTGQFPAALVGGRLDVNIGATAVTQPVSGTVTANQGTANTAANRWPTYISDGTNTLPTMDAAARRGFISVTDGTNTSAVKAASTAAVAADPSLVITFSPNTGLPTGANTIGAVTGPTADNAANPTLKLATLPARANAAAPTWTEGNVAPISVDLAGNQRTLTRGGITGTTTITAAAATANSWATFGNPVTGLDAYTSLSITAVIQGNTAGTLDFLIQMSPDNATSWNDIVRYTQLAAGAAAIVRVVTLARADSTGTSIVTTSRTATGGTAQSDLASGTVIQGDFGDRIRILQLPGSGASGAQTQTFIISGGR